MSTTFTVNRKALVAELALLNTVAGKASVIPVLSCVMLNLAGPTLTMTATDLDVSLITEIAVDADDTAHWGGCLPCAQLYALVKLLDDENVTFTLKPNRNGEMMQVSAGKSKHLLPLTAISQFPEIERVEGGCLEFSLPQLIAAIDATAFAMLQPRDETKPADQRFTGLSLRAKDGTMECMATQKVVTAVAEFPAQGEMTTILPRGAVTVLQRLEGETVAVAQDSNHVEFRVGERTMIARPLMGEFPQWRQFVPTYPYKLTVDKDTLVGAIRRATLTTATDNAVGYETMKLVVRVEEATVSTRGSNNGQSDETVAVTSNLNGNAPFAIGFIGGQVLDVLAKCEGEVTCQLAEPTKPLLFTRMGEGFEVRFIVMPIGLRGW